MPAVVPPEEISATPSPCDEVRPLLSLLIDDEATPEEAAIAKSHLAVCAACASHYAFLRLTHSVLAQQPAEFPSRALSERIAAATYARPTFAQRLRAFLAPAPTRYALGMAVAAGFAAIVVSRVHVPFPTASEGSGAKPTAAVTPGITPPVANASPAPSSGTGGVRNGNGNLPGGGSTRIAGTAHPAGSVAPGTAGDKTLHPTAPVDTRSRISAPSDSVAVAIPPHKIHTPGSEHNVTGTAPSVIPSARPASGNGGSGTIASSGSTPGVTSKIGGHPAVGTRPQPTMPPRNSDAGGGNARTAYSTGPDRTAEPRVPAPPSLGEHSRNTFAATTSVSPRPRSAEGDSEVTGRGPETVASVTAPAVGSEYAQRSLGERLSAVSQKKDKSSRAFQDDGVPVVQRVATNNYHVPSSVYGAGDTPGVGLSVVNAPVQ